MSENGNAFLDFLFKCHTLVYRHCLLILTVFYQEKLVIT